MLELHSNVQQIDLELPHYDFCYVPHPHALHPLDLVPGLQLVPQDDSHNVPCTHPLAVPH